VYKTQWRMHGRDSNVDSIRGVRVWDHGNTRGNTMTVARFTNYIRYSTTCPTGITPARWRGMLKWARTNGYL